MKVFTNTKAHGHWPVGFAAVVVAESAVLAAQMLNEALLVNGLEQSAHVCDMLELPVDQPLVKILNDGNY